MRDAPVAETSLFAARSPRNIASVCMGEMTALFVGAERGARGGSGTVRGRWQIYASRSRIREESGRGRRRGAISGLGMLTWWSRRDEREPRHGLRPWRGWTP